MATNFERLQEKIGAEHKPFIVYDVEATGIMNGLDNRITQIALAAYDYDSKSGKYELQDQIFMLAKPNKDVIASIQDGEKVTDGNVLHRLAKDFCYSVVGDIKKELNKAERKYAHDVQYPKQHSAEELSDLQEKIADLKDKVGMAYEVYESRKEMLDRGVLIKEAIAYEAADEKAILQDWDAYLLKNFDSKKEEMEKAVKIEETLKKQGLDLDRYISDDKGLTSAEMQIGVMEFLNKYNTKDTVFVNNGTHFTKHYLDKEGISLFDMASADNIIDLTQAQRSMHGGASQWTADIDTFAENYKADTGKEIKTFDALTKCLCMGEITVSACKMSVSLVSENYLQKQVAESAMSRDNDYVMSAARASTMNWIPASQHAFDFADYHFDSLEYVDFGNDRRYVDVDKMFEMNDNFEITLEGEKEPIKTWEELETKIKSLNAEISDQLLDKIHEKYNEIVQEADKERKDDLMNRYEMEDLDISALSKEDFEFLDKEYDLQHNSWAMAERHKDIKEAFVKAVENGDYEIINLPNNQKALRVMGLSDEHGTKANHGVIDIVDGKIPMDASIDVYDGINTKPVYSMDITMDEQDRLDYVLWIEREQDIKSKVDGFIQRELAKIDLADITDTGALGMKAELTPSPQLGKALLDYYGADIDAITITHGENGTAVVLSGIITNEDTSYTDTFSKDFNLSEKSEKAVDKLYKQWEHEEKNPIMSLQAQAEALFAERDSLIAMKQDLSNDVKERQHKIEEIINNKAKEALSTYGKKLGKPASLAFPVGSFDIKYSANYSDGEVKSATVLFTKDNKVVEMANFLKETDNALEVLDKAFLNYVIETVKKEISSRKDAVEELKQNKKEYDDIIEELDK